MFDNAVLAYVLIVSVSFLIYIIGRRLSPRSDKTENAAYSYACGEKLPRSTFRISISLYKHLIYFVVVDSAVILIAFASLAADTNSVFALMLYLSIVLISGLLLVRGGD